MDESLLKVVKDRELHNISITVSDDNSKGEPKLTVKLRSDETDKLPQLIEYTIKNWEDGKAELTRQD